MAKTLTITRRARRRGPTATEAARLATVRSKVAKEFPPARKRRTPASSLGARLKAARKAHGLSWYAIAKQAGIPNPNTVRDMEQGRDVRISSLQAVAKVLKLKLILQ